MALGFDSGVGAIKINSHKQRIRIFVLYLMFMGTTKTIWPIELVVSSF